MSPARARSAESKAESKDKSGKEKKEDPKEGTLVDGKFIVDNGTELGKRLLRYCFDEKTADCTFVVGPAAVEVPVHKLIISAWSQPLKSLVSPSSGEGKAEGGLEEGRLKVPLPSADPELLKAFIRYLYSGQAELTKENLDSLLELANQYEVTSLVEACLQYMDQELSVGTVCQLANVAHKYKHQALFQKYEKYIFMNAPFVLRNEGVVDLSEEVLASLLASDNLAATEIDIFQAVIRWASVDEKRKAKMENLIKHIRWGRMTLHDLMRVVRPSGLIPEDQFMAVMEYAADPEDAPENKLYEGWVHRPRFPPSVHCAVTSAFTDNTGIFYHLGTNGGKTGYTNPHPAIVHFTLSSSGGSGIENLSDRNTATNPVENRYGGEPNPWLQIEFKQHRVKLEHYFIAQEQDHYLRNWRLEAFDEGEWVPVRVHTNDTTITNTNRTAFFEAKTEGFHSRFRLYVTGPSHNGAPNFDITELEMFGYVAPLGPEEKAAVGGGRKHKGL